MERKINRVGTNTLTVSLPQSWVKKYDLKAGNSIKVEELGNVLKIIAGNPNEDTSKTICVDGLNSRLIIANISAAYIAGYREIIIIQKTAQLFDVYATYRLKHTAKSKKASLYSIITEVLPAYPGFEIVHDSDNKIILKELADVKYEEAATVFLRQVHILKEMARKVYDCIKDNNTPTEEIQSWEENVNKLSNYYWRIINKGKFPNPAQDICMYLIIFHLENISDRLYAIARWSGAARQKVSGSELERFKSTVQLITLLLDLILKFDKEKLITFRKIVQDNDEKIISMVNESKSFPLSEIQVLDWICREAIQTLIQMQK